MIRRIEAQTGGLLREDDFVASPCAHPLCYQIAYLLLDPEGGEPVPFTRFVPRETLRACLSEHLYLEPTPLLEAAMRDAIDRLWAEEDPESERTLGILKGLIARMFPADRPIPREEALRSPSAPPRPSTSTPTWTRRRSTPSAWPSAAT